MGNQPIGADPGWRRMITTVAGVQGHCESGFGRVADVFAAQLRSRRDIGGSVGVYLDGKPGSHRPAAAMWSSASGPTGASASPFPADRCGPISEFRAFLVIPARVAHLGLPTPNTVSLSATRQTYGRSCPAGSLRRSGSRLLPKPSTTAQVCVAGRAANGRGVREP